MNRQHGYNKKIKNTNPKEYENIKFRSTLECSCYKKLKSSNLDFEYESEKIILWDGTKLNNTKFYAPNKCGFKYNKFITLQTRKLINITYTPDFVVYYKDYKIYFDVKGKENDVYPLKKKMFLKILEERNDGYKYMFFEPHSVGQMLESIKIIKEL